MIWAREEVGNENWKSGFDRNEKSHTVPAEIEHETNRIRLKLYYSICLDRPEIFPCRPWFLVFGQFLNFVTKLHPQVFQLRQVIEGSALQAGELTRQSKSAGSRGWVHGGWEAKKLRWRRTRGLRKGKQFRCKLKWISGLCALGCGIHNSIEAILACHAALSKKWPGLGQLFGSFSVFILVPLKWIFLVLCFQNSV